MKTVNKIEPSSFEELTSEQDTALCAIFHDEGKSASGVWKVDDKIAAVEICNGPSDKKDEPNYWWQNGQWEPVTFLALAEVD